ncbi:MAG: hypothetical protein AYK19_19390 [Theionarchaea archaeon DG-70-1]|nr:MAG: hypothetical protein AYK19_19390 [Theionarchaea archaeon DG-70-1]
MKCEFFAQYMGKWDGHQDKDEGMQLTLLCEGILDNKEDAKKRLKEWILHGKLDKYFKKQMKIFNNLISYRLPGLRGFPLGSFILQFTFYLDKPYISTDNTSFSIIDNPLKKEKVFTLPYIVPSQWKGTLRSVMRQMKGFSAWEDEDEQMIRIFGNVKGEESNKNLCQGALHLYPTYFDRIGLEVITPHDRETGTGTYPIYFESVPIGACGEFALLYFPFNLMREDKKEVYKTVASDLRIIAKGIHEMMVMHGVGAKVSSGFGRIKRIEKGELTVKVNTKVKRSGQTPAEEKDTVVLTFESFEELIAGAEEFLKVGGGS